MKRKGSLAKFVPVGLVLTEELRAKVEDAAERRTLPMSAVVREALMEYFERREKAVAG